MIDDVTRMKKLLIALFFIFTAIMCSKDQLPKAVIYVLTTENTPVANHPVKFLAIEAEKNRNAFDTVIYTADNGQAVLETANEMVLDVEVDYKDDNDAHLYVGKTVAPLVKGKVFIDTIILKY